MVDAISDSSYSHPIDTASKIHAMKSKAPVFVYHFGYRGTNSLTQLDVNNYPPKVIRILSIQKLWVLIVFLNIQVVEKDVHYGVGNGDDLIYLFPILSGTFRYF